MAFEKFIKLFQGGQKQHDPTVDGLQLKKLELGAGTNTEAAFKLTSGALLDTTQQGAFEYAVDDLYFSIASNMPGTVYQSQYPPEQTAVYVKSTGDAGAPYLPFYATDPLLSVTGGQDYQSWISGNYPNRFHIDLGLAKNINRIYYENFHNNGSLLDRGVRAFTFYGSNSPTAFDDLTYGSDTDWVLLGTSESEFAQHSAADEADPKYITVANVDSYRYYAFKFSTNWGEVFMGVRRIELQNSPPYTRRGIILNNGSNLVTTKIPRATTNGRIEDSQISDDGTTVLFGTENPLHPITEKTTLVDADEVQGNDSATTFSPIRTTWTNVKAFLKTYFDTLYFWLNGKSGGQTAIGGTGASENLTLSSTSDATKGKIIVQDELEVTPQASVVETLVSTCSTYTKTSGQQEAVVRTESEFITDTTILTSILLETNWVAGIYSPATVPAGFIEGQLYRGDKFWYLYQNSVLTRTQIYPSIPDFTNSYLFES